jgi:anti-sigma factor ChrR (cupin superfamily)
MKNHQPDDELFDDAMVVALAQSAVRANVFPRPEVRQALMARLADAGVPQGFSVLRGSAPDWRPHAVPGIRVKVLSVNASSGYAMLLLDVAPGTRFPAHHHTAAEECYVLSGSLYTCDRRLEAGDFVHADAHTDHAELWTEDGCRVLLIAPPDEHLPSAL